MFEGILAPWRAKYKIAVASAACYGVAGVAGAIAFAFGLVALFSWLDDLFGTIIAALILAGAFVVIAVIPLIVLSSIRKREEKQAALAAAKARTTQWISPATLSLGLQAVRMLGKNRNFAIAALGTVMAGFLASQLMSRGDEPADGTDPAE